MMFRNLKRHEWLVFAILVGLGIASRFLIEAPNFKPIAAFALFGGFFFRKPMLAVVATLLILLVSDFQLGFYPLPIMISVYLAFAISIGLGAWIRRRSESSQVRWRQMPAFLGASLVMSTMFYLLTNAAVWYLGGWYPPTLSGLAECYLAAVPFYRATLAGDFCFTLTTVSVYCVAVFCWQRLTAYRPVAAFARA